MNGKNDERGIMSPHSFQRLVHVQRFWSRLSSPAQISMRRAGVLFEDSVERNRQRRMQKGGEAGKVAMELPSLHNA